MEENMNRKRFMLFFGMLLIVSLVLAACQPVTTTVEVIKTVEVPVEKQVEVVKTHEVNIIQTQVVEVARRAFSTPNPILSDLRVRQALSYCTNKAELLQAVYPVLTDEERSPLVMNTNIPRTHWAYAGDENVTIYPFDLEKGKALLDEAGWTQDPNNDFRTNANGDELSLKFTTTSAAFRQTWAAVWEQQMADCGVRIVRLHVPASWWFGDTTGINRRDFELGAWAWVGQADPSGQTLYACDQIPLPENNWVGQNGMGWCNETASNAIKQANNTLIRQERIDAYRTFQEEFTKDVPSIPLFNRTNTYAISPDLQGFAPAPGQPFVTYNVSDWEIPGRDTIVYGFTQEPASLFTLVESAQVAVLAASLVQGFAYTSLDYDYGPLIQTPMATIENNLASNNDVEVKEGDQVVDANGNIVELKPGVKVKNSAGEEVEFDGSQIMMKQLVVNYQFRDDLVWSDGVPVSQEDYELKLKIDCDPDSGATSFILCDQMQDVEYAPNGYTITWLPGVQNPLYFLSFDASGLPDIYPAHRVLSDGRKLADVPASEWTTLPEIAEDPIGVGPYVLTGWVKGEKMTFEANPYYYGGTPKTKKIVISFVTPENAEAQLLGGQVDILDDTTLVGVTETLKKASDQGTVKVIINPSDTWEHIDMNLFLP
jgi:ABC-type transport system substrate-binding protein